MGTSLQDMLTQNQTLKYLEINDDIPLPSSFLSFLTTGLRHNTSLQQLSVSIPLNEEIKTFIFNAVSNNLTELELYFELDKSYSNYIWKGQVMTSLFYEQLLPAVTDMLQSHATIRLLRIECSYINEESSQPNWIEVVQHLYGTIFIHPSLEYTEINASTGFNTPFLLVDTLKDQKKTLIDRHRKEQPHKPLPIVIIKKTDILNNNNELYLANKQSYSDNSDKLHRLKDVQVIKDRIFSVDLKGSVHSDQLINWEGYGLKVNFFEEYLWSLETHLAVQVTALAGGKFAFPENTILVSAVYAVSISIPIPMRLELQHCIDLSIQPAMGRYLRFATASIDSSSPYKFSLKEGEFRPDSWYGSSFHLRHKNCFICILGLKEIPSADYKTLQSKKQQQEKYQLAKDECQQDELQQPGGYRHQKQKYEASDKPEAQQLEEEKRSDDKLSQNDDNLSFTKTPGLANIPTQATGIEHCETYTGLLLYENKESVIFAVAKNLDALDTYLEAKHPQCKRGQSLSFRFKSEYIELIFDTEQAELIQGWRILPHMKPCRLQRCDIENLGDSYHAKAQTCLITVKASPDATPSTLHYPIPIEGIVEPVTLFIVIDRSTKEAPATFETTADVSTKEQGKDAFLTIKNWNEIVNALEDSEFSSDKWRKLGRRLNLNPVHLNNIEKNYSSVERYVEECIAEWLKTGKATYKGLVDALIKVGEDVVAINIEKTFT